VSGGRAAPAASSALGVFTLFRKELRRFMKVPGQTLLGPVVSTLLYLVVFGYALGARLRLVAGVPYFDFIVPGLVMLGITSNAFLNSSSSLMGMKLTGTIVDLLVTPLGPRHIVTAMVGAAAVRGLGVGVLTWLAAVVLRWDVHLVDPVLALAFPVLAAIAFGAVGLLTGLWADRFEQLNFVPAFVLTPLTFLGGVFYDVRSLPPTLQALSHLNPILYLVEGLRAGLLGTSAVDPRVGLAALAAATLALLAVALLLLRSGWKLRG
jgi:ABC-2 type transport system permease protein